MELKLSFSVLLFLICLNKSCASSIVSDNEDLEMERQLRILNKPPVKTIYRNEGDIIDCVDIYKQPAFDHPLLKNHKLQLEPTSYPVGMRKGSSKTKSMSKKEACPQGTVPIKRTSKSDLIRTKALSELPLDTVRKNSGLPGARVVGLRTRPTYAPYHGATAYVSIYNLTLSPDQASSINLWVGSGPPEDSNLITTGWKVSNQLNGDTITRLFTYWTGDGHHKTGCYNTLCPGFVMTDNETTTNDQIAPASTIDGDQYDIKFSIFQDVKTGNWWLSITEEDIMVGYWPKELFKHLSKDGAEHVAWGGITNAGQSGVSPPMGNGNSPIRGEYKYTRVCYFRQVQYIGRRYEPNVPEIDAIDQHVESPDCYGLHNDKDSGSKFMRYSFMFGGPGGGTCSK